MFPSKKSDVFVFRKRYVTIWTLSSTSPARGIDIMSGYTSSKRSCFILVTWMPHAVGRISEFGVVDAGPSTFFSWLSDFFSNHKGNCRARYRARYQPWFWECSKKFYRTALLFSASYMRNVWPFTAAFSRFSVSSRTAKSVCAASVFKNNRY